MTQAFHVLIVDDEVNIRNALVTMLEKRATGFSEQARERKRCGILRKLRWIW